MKKNVLLLGVSFLLIFFSLSAQSLKYSRAKVSLHGKEIRDLSKCGIDISEGAYKKNLYFISDFSAHEIEQIKKAGFVVDILVPDIQKKYREQNDTASASMQSRVQSACHRVTPVYQTPKHFSLGSMAGYFTYAEMLTQLDSMRILYPSLITAKQPISNTLLSIEGRPVYYVRLSDHADTDEPEPEVLYDAVHHAREPGSMSNLIYYMWYLLENYSSDSSVKSIVDHTEMYFVPCVNPDGYLYNETTDPMGGGMWRKNRRANGDGTMGVDLNRNYGFHWGYDNYGSSANGADEVYRGSSPFSEPETQMMRDFCTAHSFKIAMNYHTFGNLLVYPWGYLPDYYTPDSNIFVNYGKMMTRYNHYLAGTGNQTVQYVTNGDSDDWMYGDQSSKAKVFAITPEIGIYDEGFWPPISSIIPNCQDNMFANFSAAQLAGKFCVFEDRSKEFLTIKTAYLPFSFTEMGLDTAGIYTLSFTPLTSNISFANAKVYTGMSILHTLKDSLAYILNPSIASGEQIKFIVNIHNADFSYVDTIVKVFGAPGISFQERGDDVTKWNAGSWGNTSQDFYSAWSSITDSPNGNYLPSSNEMIEIKNPVSLPANLHSKLVFYAKWDIEKIWDFAQLLISRDQGASWTPLCGSYTVDGSAYQDYLNPVYEGSQASWVKEEINLDAYAGENILLMFTMNSDTDTELDGFYFDDLEIISNGNLTSSLPDFSSLKNHLQIYPNPSSNGLLRLKYHLDENHPSMIHIYDVYGRKVFDRVVSSMDGDILLSDLHLQSGIYFYGWQSDQNKDTFQKLVIY